MMARCYNPNSNGYKWYGAKGVYVCDDWFDFGTFVNSVSTMQGWEEKEADWDGWQLDKDFTGDGFCYSPETCRWVSRETNMSSSIEKFTFFREKDNFTETTCNLRKFGRKHGISHSNLSRVISGERKTAGGFVLTNVESRYEGKDQIAELIQGLKNNPSGRRHLVTAWNPSDLENLALHPCHTLFQFNCRPLTNKQRFDWWVENRRPDQVDVERVNQEKEELWFNSIGVPKYYLDCHLYQRSADVFLGVPFNIASYALLTHIIAKICNMEAGDFIHTFGDVHIYDNHMEAIEEQLSRDPHELPQLDIKLHMKDFNVEQFAYWLPEDFGIKHYTSYPAIKAKLSTGLQ